MPIFDAIKIPIFENLFGGDVSFDPSLVRNDIKSEISVGDVHNYFGLVVQIGDRLHHTANALIADNESQISAPPQPAFVKEASHTQPVGTPSDADKPHTEAPCSIETTLVFSDPAIKKFATLSFRGLNLFILNDIERIIKLGRYSEFKGSLKRSSASLVQYRQWSIPEKRIPIKSIQKSSNGKVNIPNLRISSQVKRGNTIITLFKAPLGKEFKINNQNYYFDSSIFNSIFCITLHKNEKESNFLKYTALLVVPTK